jgi:transcriptional regulator with XRE-family HTH domain
MPRSSHVHAQLSDAAGQSLVGLGARLQRARLLRNWTQAQTAQKAGLSSSSIKKVEAGSAHVTVAAYVALLDVFGLPRAFDRLLADGDDTLGEALARTGGRQRARRPRVERASEWELE